MTFLSVDILPPNFPSNFLCPNFPPKFFREEAKLPSRERSQATPPTLFLGSGLPDFSWPKIPKRGQIYQNTSNGHKIFPIALK
jgi:hypothetical protein